MTEAEWLDGAFRLEKMLEFLRGKVSARKVRLFIVGCCRRYRIETEIPDQKSWDAVHVAELYAEGNETERDLEAARRDAEDSAAAGCRAAVYATAGDVWQGALAVIEMIPNMMWQGDDTWEEERAQRAILRDVVGPLPFRPLTFEPSWPSPAVQALAGGIYEDRRFQDLPILADALEEAGCANADILTHLRQPGEHVRGCWALDLILGRT
jgi:hypothetical protein